MQAFSCIRLVLQKVNRLSESATTSNQFSEREPPSLFWYMMDALIGFGKLRFRVLKVSNGKVVLQEASAWSCATRQTLFNRIRAVSTYTWTGSEPSLSQLIVALVACLCVRRNPAHRNPSSWIRNRSSSTYVVHVHVRGTLLNFRVAIANFEPTSDASVCMYVCVCERERDGGTCVSTSTAQDLDTELNDARRNFAQTSG